MQNPEPSFVIIGGTTRAGSTSLYEYLARHHDICVSSLKETRFFLDEDYPVPVRFRSGKDPAKKYFGLFREYGRKICVEATPDYLYSPGTPRRVKDSLGNVKWIFILREPTERLISWFHFGKQTGLLTSHISFEEFAGCQLDGASQLSGQQVFRTLEQGRYSEYLRSYYDVFGKENVLSLSFDLLTHQPLELMKVVCRFIGIESSVYQDYEFLPVNASYSFGNTALQKLYSLLFHSTASTNLYLHVFDKSALRKMFHFLRVKVIEPSYFRLNRNEKGKLKISPELRKRLEDYYAGEGQRLEELSGVRFNWQDSPSSAPSMEPLGESAHI
jgi:hypothetical protein